MIDHILGRPSVTYKRTQVFLVLLFWTVTLLTGNKNGPPLVRWFSKRFRAKLTPWQVLAGTLTCMYAIKNTSSILGLEAPEPLARLYSRDFYRATWIVTALDTGFASAMHIKPKWLRDIFSVLFTGYYLLFVNDADEKLRKYRAVCTVEMLRATWEKTSNPILRVITWRHRPRLAIKRKILLPRPQGSPYSKPVVAWLHHAGTEQDLSLCRDLILDIPGGGFVCMDPFHHEERILAWARKTGKPVLAVDYSKAPEFPYPYAIHECFDVFRVLHETQGRVIGLHQGELRIVMTGDSAGANIGAATMIKILEMPAQTRLPLPISIIWTYPALDFNFTSFMPPDHLRILRQESSASLRGIAEQKDHMNHKSPLSVVDDPPPRPRRQNSWSKSFSKLPLVSSLKSPTTPKQKRVPLPLAFTSAGGNAHPSQLDEGTEADNDGEGDEAEQRLDGEKSLSERVLYWNPDRDYAELGMEKANATTGKMSRTSTLGMHLTMTSRTGFFNDRIISPSMMRAMAICYIGPRNAPDLSKNYYISPILTPSHLLAQFPPVYLLCGERDPFSDDTLIFAGRLRDAKMARKAEVIAKQNKFGESLRMSSSADARDPILDQNEGDWLTMRFIDGWSHGFMQMRALLPKVEHFFSLTADWASYSFAKYELANMPAALPTIASPVPPPDQDSISEKEDEPLSFDVAKRRGSRTCSPVPGLARPGLSQSGSANSATSPLWSSSASESNLSTAPTSVESMSMATPKRRISPSENGKLTPVQRVQQEDHDILAPSVQTRDTTPRKGSIDLESAIAAAAFVETDDILRRRRQDAVYNLGSALVTDEDDMHLPQSA